MDGAMTQALLGGKKADTHPADRGKMDTKHRMRTDGHGVPLGLAVDSANRHDFQIRLRGFEGRSQILLKVLGTMLGAGQLLYAIIQFIT